MWIAMPLSQMETGAWLVCLPASKHRQLGLGNCGGNS